MTKKSLFITAIITIIILLICFFSLIPIYSFIADKNFLSGKYDAAAKKYIFLTKIRPNRDLYKIKTANALEKLPLTYENQKLICDFLELYEDESFSFLLKQKINKFRSKIDLAIGPNYVYNITSEGLVIRWEDDSFPLKVHINSGNAEQQLLIKNAFDYWTIATKNFFSFAYTDNVKEANIRVSILDSTNSNCTEPNCLFVAASTYPIVKNNILKYMDISIFTKDPFGNPFTKETIRNTTMHEIGHALGVMGHSDNTDDLMFASEDSAPYNYYTQYQSALTNNDINTLNYLYMIIPHISNINQNKLNKKNKIHPNIVFGTKKQIRKREIQNAINYINNTPNLANGYLHLGAAYVQDKNYKKAFETYKKAYSLSIDINEKYLIAYNLAIICDELGYKKNALEYAYFAKKLISTNEIDELINNIKYPIRFKKKKIKD